MCYYKFTGTQMRTYGGEMMYKNLREAMERKNISVDVMAKVLNVHRNTITNKLDGQSEFSYGQAELIQEVMFPEYNLKYLFQRENGVA